MDGNVSAQNSPAHQAGQIKCRRLLGGTKWKEDMLAPGQGEGSEPCPLGPERGCGYRTGQKVSGMEGGSPVPPC